MPAQLLNWSVSLGIAGLLVAVVAGCSSPRDTAEFSLDYPENWKPRPNDVGSPMEVIAPLEAGDTDEFNEHVRVDVSLNQGRLTLDELYRQQFNADQMRQLIPGFAVLTESDERIGRYAAKRMVYRHSIQDRSFQVLTYLIHAGPRTYLLTCTAERESFKKYLPIFENICHSFEPAEVP